MGSRGFSSKIVISTAACLAWSRWDSKLTMEKKLPIIHSKMTVRVSSRGPTKKKMPLVRRNKFLAVVRVKQSEDFGGLGTYTTGDNPSASPQPIMTIAKVKVEITKLGGRQYLCANAFFVIQSSHYPTKPSGVGLAKRLILSPAWGVLGVR